MRTGPESAGGARWRVGVRRSIGILRARSGIDAAHDGLTRVGNARLGAARRGVRRRSSFELRARGEGKKARSGDPYLGGSSGHRQRLVARLPRHARSLSSSGTRARGSLPERSEASAECGRVRANGEGREMPRDGTRENRARATWPWFWSASPTCVAPHRRRRRRSSAARARASDHAERDAGERPCERRDRRRLRPVGEQAREAIEQRTQDRHRPCVAKLRRPPSVEVANTIDGGSGTPRSGTRVARRPIPNRIRHCDPEERSIEVFRYAGTAFALTLRPARQFAQLTALSVEPQNMDIRRASRREDLSRDLEPTATPSRPPPSAVKRDLLDAAASAASSHDPPELLAFYARLRTQATGTALLDATPTTRDEAARAAIDGTRAAYSGPTRWRASA
jgi:hypothetical protein